MDAAAAGNSHALIGIGLACEVLFSPDAQRLRPLNEARIRLEPRLNNARLSANEALKWAGVAKRIIKKKDE